MADGNIMIIIQAYSKDDFIKAFLKWGKAAKKGKWSEKGAPILGSIKRAQGDADLLFKYLPTK